MGNEKVVTQQFYVQKTSIKYLSRHFTALYWLFVYFASFLGMGTYHFMRFRNKTDTERGQQVKMSNKICVLEQII